MNRRLVKRLGGNYWKKGSTARVYFNLRMAIYGLEVTGQLAVLDGEILETGQAQELIGRLYHAENVYFSVNHGRFFGKGLEPEDLDRLTRNFKEWCL